MSENKDQEKSEKPTGKRLEDARGRGQTPLSREMTGALLFVMVVAAIRLGGAEGIQEIVRVTLEFFSLPVNEIFGLNDPTWVVDRILVVFGVTIFPIFFIAFAASALGGFLQIGVKFSGKALEPKFDKLNPANGVKKLFGLDNIVLTVSNLLKLTLVGIVCWVTVTGSIDQFRNLSGMVAGEILFELIDLIFLLVFRVAGGLLFIGLIDLIYRRWKHQKDLMMSKQDVKEESKQSDGDPQVKARIRDIQRKAAMQRMKSDVEDATLVVRNPTHFAVALKYKEGDDAPRVVAKGRALMALTIIRIAEEAGVEVISQKPLARELYRTVKVGEWIPERLFHVVAELLAALYRKKGGRTQRAAAERGTQ